MITILRGPRAALLAEASRLFREGGAIVLSSRSPRAWNGVRQLVEELGRRSGASAQRPAPFGAAMSLVLGRPAEELSSDDRRRRDALAARPDSHLSHNLLVQRPLFEQVAATLDAAARDCGAPLVVPDLALLDRESLGALRTLYRRFPDTAPDLVAGFDPGRATPAPDADGLIWEHEAEDVWRIAFGLLSVPGSRLVELDGAEEEQDGSAPPLHAEGQGLDEHAFALLAQGSLSEEDVARVLAGQCAAFEGYAFTTALRLGLGLLAANPPLTPEQAADLHALTALSAHNRQFLTRGNQPLADFLERHLLAGWEVETRPARRSALAYRLAVALARRQKRFEEALGWVERAVAAAADPELPRLQAAHLEAWAENIRALALLRSGREAEAMESCERAFDRLDAAIGGQVEEAAVSPDALEREVAFTHALLADNLAALYHREGGERFVRWKAEGDRIAAPFPDLLRFEAITWIELYRGTGRLGAALAKAEKGLAAARAEQDAIREYTYAVHVADLHDRRGEAREAFEAFAAAQELHRRLGHPRFLRDVAPQAAAALRAGLLDEAEHRFAELLAGPGLSLDGRAQLLAAWGEVAARRGDATAAEPRLNAAIQAAVESGERDTLLAVAVAAGRAAWSLGREEEARDAFLRALQISETEADRPAPPALKLAALLGILEAEGPDANLTLRALARFGEALDDADAWWEIDRLNEALDRAGCRERAAAEHAEPLERLARAAEERSR